MPKVSYHPKPLPTSTVSSALPPVLEADLPGAKLGGLRGGAQTAGQPDGMVSTRHDPDVVLSRAEPARSPV